MSFLRRSIVGIACVGAAVFVAGETGALAWLVNAASSPRSMAIIAIAFGVLALAALAVTVLARSRAKRQRADRERSETMRVAAAAIERASLPTSSISSKTAAAPTGDGQTQISNAPMRRAETDAHDVEPWDDALDAEPSANRAPGNDKRLEHENELFFQPVINLETGAVAFYDTMRRRKSANHAPALFDKSGTALSLHRGAAFELHTAEKALAASRQLFHAVDDKVRLLVHISEALLGSDLHFTALKRLLNAQEALHEGVVFVVDGRALVTRQDECMARLIALHQIGAEIGVEGIEFDHEIVRDEIFYDIKVAMVDFQLAFRTANTPDFASSKAVATLRHMLKWSTPFAITGIASDGDVADAIDIAATYGSGPLFSPPKRLRGGQVVARNDESTDSASRPAG